MASKTALVLLLAACLAAELVRHCSVLELARIHGDRNLTRLATIDARREVISCLSMQPQAGLALLPRLSHFSTANGQ
jgi:hypothetical protein